MVMVVLAILTLIASSYILIYFQHEEDKNAAWAPKAVVMASLWLTMLTMLMLPLDTACARQFCLIPMEWMWIGILLIDVVFLILIIPFTVFYYESNDPTEPGKSQFLDACKVLLLVGVPSLGLIGVAYLFLGRAEVPVTALYSPMLPTVNDTTFLAPPTLVDDPSFVFDDEVLDIRISVALYLIAMMSLLGSCAFACCGGIGLAALPSDLIQNFRFRPKVLNAQDFAKQRIACGERATTLIEIGNKMMEAQYKKKGTRTKKDRKTFNRFKQNVYLLDEDWRKLSDAHHRRGAIVAGYYGQLLAGIVCTVMSLLWVAQAVTNLMMPEPPTGLLSDFFVSLDSGALPFGSILFGIFAMYLLICMYKGNFKFGMRIFIGFEIHPMIIGRTLMNSFLFNCVMFILGSVAIAQICTKAFSTFVAGTQAAVMFNVAVDQLIYVTYFWQVYHIFWITCAFFTVLGIMIWPSDRVELTN